MHYNLLTKVLIRLANKKESAQEYGVSILNIPAFDYVDFVKNISSSRKVEFFFLGYANNDIEQLKYNLPESEHHTYSFSIEAAEESRNSGDETVFRIFVIRRAEIEKLSSLRWFPEITVDMVYNESCDLVQNMLSDTNSVIKSLIKALKRKTIRNILSFERVIEYLDGLCSVSLDELPVVIKDTYYKLGLLQDKTLDQKNPSTDEIVEKIKHNHDIVERIGNLEQAERQCITNYYASDMNDKKLPRMILQYYSKRSVELLEKMELSQVEECLKAAKKKPRGDKPKPPQKAAMVKATALASQLIFDNNQQQIPGILKQLEIDIDERTNIGKREKIEVDVDGVKLQINAEPITEKIATELTDSNDFGGIIYADVNSPDEAINDIDKYEYKPFKRDILDYSFDKLKKISPLIQGGEKISGALSRYLKARKAIAPFKIRLQDTPMFPILTNKVLFKDYIKAYEQLLLAINGDYPKILAANASSTIKLIINTIISLDNVFVIGDENIHAMPTMLNPLFLWKYIKLAEELLESKGVNESNENVLSEDDKSFIVRKSEDIPDPLSIMLLPVTVSKKTAIFLPLVGRIGSVPIYSTNKQINQSESGIEALKQSIIRYLCLYPHASMMLKISIIDPPSVELIVLMLKKLNSDKEFNITGIDLSIYRTKEANSTWIEIDDASINDGMLGLVKGKRSLNFRMKIVNKKRSYAKILDEISDDQHILVIFDPNEVKTEIVKNDKQIHIHPLCIPKIYQYNPVEEEVVIRPANEGDVFSTYGSIVEKLNEHPSSFSHTSSIFNTPLKKDTYYQLLEKCDWLVILDQSLKNWDISLSAASEKLFYKEDDYRSIGIYSKHCKKFIQGYRSVIARLGNYIPKDEGIAEIIRAIRLINDDGLLSIVSHSSNKIFDDNHGKGSLGLAIAAIHYLRKYPNAILVGLDTQLAREWLSGRDDNYLPDLVGIRLNEMLVDIVEVKTHGNNARSFEIKNERISGHAVEQSTILEALMYEIFSSTERITTVSRREILRQQVYETLFQIPIDPSKKHELSEHLNSLFAGEYKVSINKNICFVDFENPDSTLKNYEGEGAFSGQMYMLNTIGRNEIQAIVSAMKFVMDVTSEERNRYLENSLAYENKANNDEIKADKKEMKSTDDAIAVDNEQIIEKCNRLNKVLKDYSISAMPINPELVQEAARFTRFTVELKSGETIRSIEKSKADIAIQLEANGEILVNHIRGTKYISVDVPFAGSGKPVKLINYLKMLDGDIEKLNIVAGQMPNGKLEFLDIARAPHLLVAGTTGSGKTIFLYSIIISLLEQFDKDEIQFLIIDPKQTDFVFFDDLPNLYGGKVFTDTNEALVMLNQINEVDKEVRMKLIRSCKSRDINSYNKKNPNNKMNRMIVIIDEYADLIQTAEMQGNRKEFERSLSMLAQKVRSLGIHLIIATQRPSANIVTGVLKANIPYRISFRLPSHTDSQTILDMSGAENLLGTGDMLVVTESDVKRMQGLFITETELTDFVEGYVKKQ